MAYIELEAAIEKCREIVACEWNHRASPASWADAYEQFAEDLEGLPSADVAPVRHGQWNEDETCPFCGEKSTEGLDAEKWNYWFPEFCPNCGARMDGDG